MKRYILAVFFGGLALSLLGVAAADDKAGGDKTAGDKKADTALPPHPLDPAFERGTTEKAIDEGLLNNPLFQKAVRAALQAKRDQEKRFRDNPNLRDASPAQAARRAFLEVLQNQEPAGKAGK